MTFDSSLHTSARLYLIETYSAINTLIVDQYESLEQSWCHFSYSLLSTTFCSVCLCSFPCFQTDFDPSFSFQLRGVHSCSFFMCLCPQLVSEYHEIFPFSLKVTVLTNLLVGSISATEHLSILGDSILQGTANSDDSYGNWATRSKTTWQWRDMYVSVFVSVSQICAIRLEYTRPHPDFEEISREYSYVVLGEEWGLSNITFLVQS